MSTYTGIVSFSRDDWAEYDVEVVDDFDESTEGSASWRTHAYDGPDGEFNWDFYDDATLAKEVIAQLAAIGWRPTVPLTFRGKEYAVDFPVARL